MQKIGDKENIRDIKKQLEGCIKVILKEDSDSEALSQGENEGYNSSNFRSSLSVIRLAY